MCVVSAKHKMHPIIKKTTQEDSIHSASLGGRHYLFFQAQEK
jgi:hypothetical protein